MWSCLLFYSHNTSMWYIRLRERERGISSCDTARFLAVWDLNLSLLHLCLIVQSYYSSLLKSIIWFHFAKGLDWSNSGTVPQHSVPYTMLALNKIDIYDTFTLCFFLIQAPICSFLSTSCQWRPAEFWVAPNLYFVHCGREFADGLSSLLNLLSGF